jgi:hypothetical protein
MWAKTDAVSLVVKYLTSKLNQDLLTPAYNSVAYSVMFLVSDIGRYEARLTLSRE